MRKRIIYILLVILVIVTGVALYIYLSTYFEDAAAAKEYNLYGSKLYLKSAEELDLSDTVVEVDQDITTETETVYDEYVLTQKGINWNAFKRKNQDFIGIISIPELNIWYPIVQNSEDNYSYYLTHTYSGDENASGSIFLDYMFDKDLSDNHSIIFGHNMKNLTMFGSLRTLLDSKYTNDLYVYIYTEERVLIYKIYAAYLTKPDSADYYAQLPGTNYSDYYTNAIESAQYLDADEQVKQAYTKRNNLLTLSTCHSSDHSDYTVVQSILVERINIK